MTDRDVATDTDEDDEHLDHDDLEDTPMTYRSTRAAAAAMLGASAACLVAVSTGSAADARDGDGAYPLKNSVYKGAGEVASQGYRASVKIKVGNNIAKVDKLTIKIRCPEGKQKYVKKNLAIDTSGYIFWDQRWPVYFFGQFTTRHKVDRVSVKGDETLPCSTYVVNMDVRD